MGGNAIDLEAERLGNRLAARKALDNQRSPRQRRFELDQPGMLIEQ